MAETDVIHSLAAGKHGQANSDFFWAAFALHEIQFPHSGVRKPEDDNTKGLERFLIPARRVVVGTRAAGKRHGTDRDVVRAAFTLHNFQFHNPSVSGGSTKGCRGLLDLQADDSVCLSGNGSRKRMRFEKRSASSPTQKPRVLAISAAVMAEIEGQGGSDVCVVAEKVLTKSDMNKAQGRFLIAATASRVLRDYLTQEERNLLDLPRGEIRVTLIEPCLETRELALKKWKVGGSFSYVLTGGWNAIVGDQSNGLVEGVKVQLGSYRSQGRLCFALVKVEEGRGCRTREL